MTARPDDDHARAEKLLAPALAYGAGILEDLARAALLRLAAGGAAAALRAGRLWTHAELAGLAEALAAVDATADLLGRARVRIRLEQAARRAAGRGGW